MYYSTKFVVNQVLNSNKYILNCNRKDYIAINKC